MDLCYRLGLILFFFKPPQILAIFINGERKKEEKFLFILKQYWLLRINVPPFVLLTSLFRTNVLCYPLVDLSETALTLKSFNICSVTFIVSIYNPIYSRYAQYLHAYI